MRSSSRIIRSVSFAVFFVAAPADNPAPAREAEAREPRVLPIALPATGPLFAPACPAPACQACHGGVAGIRTPDLRRAKAALSRLSYDPLTPARPASWARLDSNQGPRSYQDRALTT